MLSRSALAASITVTATLVSGIAAFAATTDTKELSTQSAGASVVAAPAVAPGAATPVGDPGAPRSPSPTPAAPPNPTTTPPTTPPSTNPPPFNCSGSDDGLSEAVKHARETYCHGEGEE